MTAAARPEALLTKSQISALVARGEGTEVFSHETIGHFNISALRELVKVWNPVVSVAKFSEVMMVDGIKVDAMAYLFKNRDIDLARCAELTKAQLIEPALVVDVPAGVNGNREMSNLIVDGMHRIWRRHQLGKPEFYFYAIPLGLCPMISRETLEVYEKMVPEQPDWGNFRVRPDGTILDRRTGEKVESTIPGVWENGRRVDQGPTARDASGREKV